MTPRAAADEVLTPPQATSTAMAIAFEIHFHGLDPSPPLEAYARGWLDRLVQRSDQITSCVIRVELPPRAPRYQRHRGGRQYRVDITLVVAGTTLTVSREPGDPTAHESAYGAVRDAFVAVRRQVDDLVARRAAPLGSG